VLLPDDRFLVTVEKLPPPNPPQNLGDIHEGSPAQDLRLRLFSGVAKLTVSERDKF